jgi:predicted GNAT family N-acyltransferase
LEYPFDNLEVERLKKTHDTSKFDCEDPDINDFLKNDALSWQQQKHTTVFLFIDKKKEEIVGFCTVSCNSIKLKDSEKEECKDMNCTLKEFPGIKVGRLGVDKKVKKQGIGSAILKWAIGYSLDMSDKIACRFVIVDAYQHLESWYNKQGFVRNEVHNNKNRDTISMRYDLFNALPLTAQTTLAVGATMLTDSLVKGETIPSLEKLFNNFM